MAGGELVSASRPPLTRRALLAGSAAAGGLALLGRVARSLDEPEVEPAFAGGELMGTVPFLLEPREPLNTRFGEGLDARLYTDLSTLEATEPTTPPAAFYIRTGTPDGFDPAKLHHIKLGGRLAEPKEIAVSDLLAGAEDQGIHVVECAGNGRWTRFGLLSAGRFRGVPLTSLLSSIGPAPDAAALRVRGVDDHARRSTTSTAGCEWIFPLDQLATAGAFLATHLDGHVLTPDHGAPVRLAMPGWYGCCWIKWISALELVGEDEPATSQMKEFALRTYQEGVPERAAAYRPATVDSAALPVRVERWRLKGVDRFRVVGLYWGGRAPTDRLTIRFRPDASFERVAHQPRPTAAGSFAWWSHPWQPPAPGRYLIQLAVDDPGVVARRLAAGFYVRALEIPSSA